MFTPINKEITKKKLKGILQERRDIKCKYYQALISLDIDIIYNLEVRYEENSDLLNQIKEFFLYNYVMECTEEIDIAKYDILRYKRVLFSYIDKLIDKKEYIKAKKLINICRARGYEGNELYRLIDKLKTAYYNIEKFK